MGIFSSNSAARRGKTATAPVLGKCSHPNLKVARFVNNDTKPPTIGLDYSCNDCSASWSEVA
jgi:hypothetical protein